MSPAVAFGLVAIFTVGIYFFAKRGKKSPAEAAIDQLAMGNTIRAEMLIGQAVKRAESKHGKDHPDTATVRLQQGVVLARAGNADDALEAFRAGHAVPPKDEAQTEARKASLEAYAQLLAELAIRAFKSRNAKKAKALLEEAAKVVEQDSPVHGFVTAQLGAIKGGRMPDFGAREKAIGKALTARIQKETGDSELLTGMDVNLGLSGFSAEPVLSRDPTPEEAHAIGQALREAFTLIEKDGVDAFLAS